MELVVENLGRIRQARVELRPLTVFVGPNHTNKTWLAYAALAGLRDLSEERWSPYEDPRPDRLLNALEVNRVLVAVRNVVSTGGAGSVRVPTHGLVQPGTTWSWLVRSSDVQHMVGADIGSPSCSIVIHPEDPFPAPDEIGIEIRADRADPTTAELVFTVQHGGELPRHYATAGVSRAVGAGEAYLRFVILQLFRATFTVARAVVPFPIERVSSPIGDSGVLRLYQQHLELLRTMPELGIADHTSHVDTVLSGSLRAANGGSLSFRFRDGPELPVRASASLVRSLAALGLYVSRRPRSGDWLVIDEPEMNAHPEAQLAIAELLALLVSSGIRVLFTTHSPYIVDHLNNLMAASRVPLERRPGLEQAFALRDPRAFVDPELVGAYEFREAGAAVEVVDVLDRHEALISNRTFGAQTERLGDIYNAILDRT